MSNYIYRYKLKMNFDLKRALENTRAYFETVWNQMRNIHYVEVVKTGEARYIHRKYGDHKYTRLLEETTVFD